MEKLMAELKQEYDFVILDTPPIAIVTDAIILSKFAGASVFVIRHNFSSKDVVYLADELTEKLSSLNVLVNDVSAPGYFGYSFKYGYKYSYGYRYNYGYNYYTTGHEYYGETEEPKSIFEKIKKFLS
jgi:Mrp family chromosome partitioning ATPase